MGYRSVVAFKTTTEGWIIMKRMNDAIKTKEERPLDYMEIQKTESGFYKISHDELKWYDSYKDVQNFQNMMDTLDDQDIPYSFVRIGEDHDDIETRQNYTSDMPDELAFFEPNTEIYDENEGEYIAVSLDKEDEDIVSKIISPLDRIESIMFTLFDECEEADDIKDRLRDLNSGDKISDDEYNECLDRWDTILLKWKEGRRDT